MFASTANRKRIIIVYFQLLFLLHNIRIAMHITANPVKQIIKLNANPVFRERVAKPTTGIKDRSTRGLSM